MNEIRNFIRAVGTIKGKRLMYSLYSSLIINISLLVLIATLLTKITFVKQVMAEEHAYRTMDQLILVVIFGGFCIFSTCSGVRVNGAIQNTRVLGALAAGLLGGPMVGMGAGSPVPLRSDRIYLTCVCDVHAF